MLTLFAFPFCVTCVWRGVVLRLVSGWKLWGMGGGWGVPPKVFCPPGFDCRKNVQDLTVRKGFLVADGLPARCLVVRYPRIDGRCPPGLLKGFFLFYMLCRIGGLFFVCVPGFGHGVCPLCVLVLGGSCDI